MLPEFIRLGYDRNEFLSDTLVHKLTEQDIFKIRKHFVMNLFFKKIYRKQAIDFYIGKYFAAIACPNNAIDYTLQLNKLKAIDGRLYEILENFSLKWIEYDYECKEPIKGSYHTFLFEFIERLEEWTVDKIII